MARFDDQFERHDPLTLKFDAPSDTWPRRVAFEAQSVLSDAARTETSRIGHFIDLLISWRAEQLTVPTLTSRGPKPPKDMQLELKQRRKEIGRALYGDVHLLGAGGGTAEALAQLRPVSEEFTAADLYAVLALWKLIDYLDLRRPASAASGMPHFLWAGAADAVSPAKARTAARRQLQEEALAEAAYAAATAWRLREAALLRDGLQAAVDEANRARDLALEEQERVAKARDREAKQRKQDQEKRRKAGKAGAAGRWSPLPEHKAKAWELANGQTFRSRAAAARHAAAYIPKDEDGNEYTVDTVDGWLKDAGWKRKK